MYADDTQLYISFKPHRDSSYQAINTLEACIKDVKSWFEGNMLRLNPDKTEVLYIHSKHRSNIPIINKLSVDNVNVTPSAAVKNLGIIFDQNMSMEKHVNSICKIMAETSTYMPPFH